jgi:Mg2+-importing ATPase
MATSANFGNMFSVAIGSVFLPFLPLLPKQVLLTNLVTDLPEMTIAADRVDAEMIASPRRWDVRFIRRFMILFGVVSSAFDLLTFCVLRGLLDASNSQFRSGWFVESAGSSAIIVLVVRTRKPFLPSRPGTALLVATLAVSGITLVLPNLPEATWLGFDPIPLAFYAALVPIVVLCVIAAEGANVVFYRCDELGRPRGRAVSVIDQASRRIAS